MGICVVNKDNKNVNIIYILKKQLKSPNLNRNSLIIKFSVEVGGKTITLNFVNDDGEADLPCYMLIFDSSSIVIIKCKGNYFISAKYEEWKNYIFWRVL